MNIDYRRRLRTLILLSGLTLLVGACSSSAPVADDAPPAEQPAELATADDGEPDESPDELAAAVEPEPGPDPEPESDPEPLDSPADVWDHDLVDPDNAKAQLSADDPAEHFALLDEEFENRQELSIDETGPELRQRIGAELAILEQQVAEYEHLADADDTQWAVAAHIRIAEAYGVTIGAIDDVSAPAFEQDQEGMEQRREFTGAKSGVTLPLRTAQREAYEQALQAAGEHHIEADWTEKAIVGITEQLPDYLLDWLEEFPQMGDFATAYYRDQCDAGTLDACVEAARLIVETEALDADAGQIVSPLEHACDADSAYCHELGSLVAEGEHVERDWTRAVSLMEKSCDAGNGEGCLTLARLYDAGDGVDADEERASELYEEACDQRIREACKEHRNR